MNDSARAGLEQLGARGEARGADSVLGAARSTVRRRRDHGRAVLALGVLVVVGLAAALVVTRDSGGGDSGREIVTHPGEDEGAPPTDGGPLAIFLSDTVLPTSGGEVIAIVRNAGTEDWTGGYGVSIDRWDGFEWQSVGQYPEPQLGGTTDVGLRAPAGGAGDAERVLVPSFEPGWYRLRKGASSRDVKPTGTFEVRDGDVRMIDLPMGQHGLSIEPTLLDRSDGGLASGHLTLTFAIYHSSPPGYSEEITATLSADARLERWDGASWVQVAILPLAPDAAQPGRATTEVPADLTPGAYRVTRSTQGPDANGYFFVVDGAATPAPDGAPPPPDGGPITLFLSETVLPASGVDLVAVLHNRGTEGAMFGVRATLDRWDGREWHEVTALSTCLDHWFCMASLDAPTFVLDIGLGAAPGQYGVTEWVRVEGLTAGWYRLRKVANEGVVATGTFRVVDDAISPIDYGDVTADKLSVWPPVVASQCPPAGPCGVRIDVMLRGGGAPDLDAFEAALSESARVERWVDGAWLTAGEVDFSIEGRADWQRGPGQRMAALPPDLEPGAYRVVRTAPDGTMLAGHFFVET